MSNLRLEQAFIGLINKIAKAKNNEPNPVQDLAEFTQQASVLLSTVLEPKGKVIGATFHKARNTTALFKACVGFILKNKIKKKKDTFCTIHVFCTPTRRSEDFLERTLLEVKVSYPKTENKLMRALETGWDKSGIPIPQNAEDILFSETLENCMSQGKFNLSVFNEIADAIISEAKEVQGYIPGPEKPEKLKMTESELNEALKNEILNTD